MLQLILNIVFVLVAISMIALILMQRGAGAQAGSGFGGGASATVFGARGASSFLTKSTKWLAIVFFALTLFMAWQATNMARQSGPAAVDLGVMSEVPAAPAAPAADTAVPSAPQAAPIVPDATVPAVPEDQPPAASPPSQGETGREVPQGG
ncbi:MULTISPECIES: preprotein translocase subunit SecG [unclassified Luteimonas]|uniref:preprotein translocase subunit SecG n=1 Tax=unclassified Luteimonas TaxID=2629088 RepID=UPI0018F0ED4E|nr:MULTISPECIES: preprotein translocase subunit SecG [unclassified Luteimonas]MBJ6979309.1 preprotein translocase subunit SecG [Luteimonas sp. MC1895]MBJ6984473.1 preprotein translocase subunit SecG [Luteimonas sp. MC1750]QQO04914.1 preprotein translocase subunit SecG [Luteimonas sp. MC1750]